MSRVGRLWREWRFGRLGQVTPSYFDAEGKPRYGWEGWALDQRAKRRIRETRPKSEWPWMTADRPDMGHEEATMSTRDRLVAEATVAALMAQIVPRLAPEDEDWVLDMARGLDYEAIESVVATLPAAEHPETKGTP